MLYVPLLILAALIILILFIKGVMLIVRLGLTLLLIGIILFLVSRYLL